jgi:hypothetical protein
MELDSQMKLGFTTLIFSSIFLAWVYRLPLNQTGSLFDNGGCGQLLESGWLWRPEHVWQPCTKRKYPLLKF